MPRSTDDNLALLRREVADLRELVEALVVEVKVARAELDELLTLAKVQASLQQ